MWESSEMVGEVCRHWGCKGLLRFDDDKVNPSQKPKLRIVPCMLFSRTAARCLTHNGDCLDENLRELI